MTDSNVLEIKTVQIAPFRTLMTALKDILLETNIVFKPDGIRIVNMDKSHTILAHLFLDAEKFEHYYCKYPKIIIKYEDLHSDTYLSFLKFLILNEKYLNSKIIQD